MKVEIDITDLERQALEKEYRLLGLDLEVPGNKPSHTGRVIKKLVEAMKKETR